MRHPFLRLGGLEASVPGRVSFDLSGLEALTRAQVAALNETEWDIELRGLRTLSAEGAEAMIRRSNEFLVFTRLETLPPDAARALSTFRGRGINEFSLNIHLAAKNVRAVDDDVLPLSIGKMSRDFALFLRGLRSLSGEVAEGLCAKAGPGIQLDEVTTLSVEAATAIAKGQRLVSLRGLEELEVEVAEAIANANHPVDLSGLIVSLLKSRALWLPSVGISTYPESHNSQARPPTPYGIFEGVS